MVPSFYSQTNSDRFGFHQLIVPPGMEPDLQALNNPFIAEKHVKEHQLAAAHTAGSGVVHQPPQPYAGQSSITVNTASTTDRALSGFEQNLDPSLQGPVVSGNTRPNDEDDDNGAELAGDSEDGEGNGYEGDQTNTSDDKSDDYLTQPHQQAPASLICFIVLNHTLTFVHRLQG